MARILVVDDDPALCSMLVKRLGEEGYHAESSLTLFEGLETAFSGDFDIVFLDVNLPDGNGVEYLARFSGVPSAPEIIIMTGAGDPDGAQQAILTGAWSYLEKPHVLRDLLLPLTRALQYREEKKACSSIPVALKREWIVGDSEAINRCLDELAHAASSDAPVLIAGETGTGKEVFARALHANSKRAHKSFVVVDCASLPQTLIESTLFGHVKGSYTGADQDGVGLIQLADGGTLFLDEIGELPLSVQKTFLRVLQEHRYRPVGSSTEKNSDFRVVAATNRELQVEVEKGGFRNDLLFRLRSFSINLPPLRDRLEDIPDLVQYTLARFCERVGVETKVVSGEFLECLAAYNWPGNVRELEQLLEEVFTRARENDTLFAYHLPQELRIAGVQANLSGNSTDKISQESLCGAKPLPWRQYKAVMESRYMVELMAYCDGDVKQACRVSGISRARLYQLLSKNSDHSV